MAKYTAVLSAQNTSIKICDIDIRHDANDWYATALLGGTFGTGTVSLQVSPDAGVTKFTINQDGTATAASATAAGALNIRLGNNNTNSNPLELYASIATAVNPAITISVFDNR